MLHETVEATSLILEPLLPPMAGGVEVMIVETPIAFQDHEGEPDTVARLSQLISGRHRDDKTVISSIYFIFQRCKN